MPRTVIQTDKAPAPVGAYNQAIAYGGVLYVSGQIAINPATGNLVTNDLDAETRQVMDNLGAILAEAGTDYSQVLRCTVFVTDMANFGRINAIYAEYFDAETAPARALVEVGNLPKYVNVEISCVAALE